MNYTDLTREQLISELSKKDETITQFNTDIRKLEKDMARVNKKLEEAEALKSHFISNICNELVNPFTSVSLLADNILSANKESWKTVISMVALIHSEVSHLDFQLKNIFAAAKLEAGELVPEISSVDIDSLMNNVIDVFKYELRHKRLKIKYTPDNKNADTKIIFKSDPEKLNLVMANLISNAVKFSKQDGEILITATRDLDELVIKVQDFGVGISKQDEAIIFDRFKRIDTGINSINRGHGLGLSVNKAVLDILDGRIEFDSTIKKGATFIITIPESELDSAGFSSDSNELFFKEETF